MQADDKRVGLRSRLREEALVGLFVKLPGFEVIDCAKNAGFDFVVIDREHSALDERTVLDQIAYGRALGLPALVRLPEVDVPVIGRLLDAGAAGVQVSDVTKREQVDTLVAATRFPPEGERGVAPSVRAGHYGRVPVSEYVHAAPDPLLVIQVERALNREELRALLAAPIDVCFIGAVDLSANMGSTGELTPDVRGRITAICDAAEEAGVAIGAHGMGPEVDARARYRTLGADVTALAERLAELKSRGLGAR